MFDVVVVGLGVGVLFVVCCVVDYGLFVVVIEKMVWYGGMLVVLGGGIWVLCNYYIVEFGVIDLCDVVCCYFDVCMVGVLMLDKFDVYFDCVLEMLCYLELKMFVCY